MNSNRLALYDAEWGKKNQLNKLYHCVCYLICTDRNTENAAIEHTLTAASL